MPNSRSAAKRLRQDTVRKMRNRARKSQVKTEVRKFLDALREKDVTKASDQFVRVTRQLDQVAAKGTLHPNNVARRKSRLAKRLNALKAGEA